MNLSELRPGERLLERYEIVKTLGEGSFGVVYQARQLSTGQDVAIKMLLRQKAVGSEQLAEYERRFSREIRLIARLRGPHSIQLIDSGFIENCPFMVLEFVEGETLDTIIGRGPLPTKVIRRVFGHILEAVAEAHDLGIVHRDLKPANLIVTGHGRRLSAKVLDFGIAGIEANFRSAGHTSITRVGKVWGSPQYMAPEQFRQFATPRVESDIYALGLIMLECIQGFPAVRANEIAEIVRKQLHEPIHIPPEIRSGPFGGILVRSCAKRPEERFSSADQMLAALEHLDTGTLSMRSPGTQPLSGDGGEAPRYDTSDLSPRHPSGSSNPRPGTLELPDDDTADARSIIARRGPYRGPAARLPADWSQPAGTKHFEIEERAELARADHTTGVQPAAIAELGDTLESILERCSEAPSWDAALELLEQRVDGEPRAPMRALIHYAMAIICFEQFDDVERALEACELALDDDPTESRAFQAIQAMLEQHGQWGLLAAHVERQIERLLAAHPEQEPFLLELYTIAAELYRSRLGDWEAAIEALLHARSYAPDAAHIIRSLAELYQFGEGHEREAAELLRELVLRSPGSDPGEVRNLFQLEQAQGHTDAAWCAASVLDYLGQMSRDEQLFFEHHRPDHLPRPHVTLSEDALATLSEPPEPLIGEIFALLYRAAAHTFSWELARDWQLSDAHRVEPDSDWHSLIGYYEYFLPRRLELKTYFAASQSFGARHANTLPPALLLGQTLSESELSVRAFLVSRQLVLANPELLLAGLGLSFETLEFLLFGALIHSFPERYPEVDPAYQPILRGLEQLAAFEREHLRGCCHEITLRGELRPQLEGWLLSVERLANRVGLLLCGDLGAAIRGLQSASEPPTWMSLTEAESDLLRLLFEPSFLDLRSHLGVAIT